MLKIWGRLNSVNVKKALWALEDPTGLVPTIDDGGFVLWESHSIVRYPAAKHGAGTLWPTDLKVRADAERWMDWTFTFQREFQRPIFWPLVRTPPEKRDMNAIKEARKKCAELLAILDQALATKPYLAGGVFTMGDIPLGCHVQLWMRLPIERPQHPHLTAWFNRLCTRPAFKKIVDIPLS